MDYQEKMTLEDWLDDLCVRFIINLPQEDLSSVARICFQVEEAHWFYEDFIRPLDPGLPNMSLRTFCMRIFQHCPLLASFSEDSHIQAFEEFMKYKVRIPVRGAILLNQAMDSVVLVRGWKKTASWSFPRGKINKDEDDLDCAIREVAEETGFDAREAGLVEKVPFSINLPMRDQQVLLYVIPNVPDNTKFEPRTRNEIGAIKWYKIKDLPAYRKKRAAGRNDDNVTISPNKFYMVAPFLVKLRDWIRSQRKQNGQLAEKIEEFQEEIFGDDEITPGDVQIPPPAEPLTPGYLESATKELHRLLQLRPPTEGLQASPSNSNPNAAATLMSLLQPRGDIANGQASESNYHYPHTPLDHTIPEAPEPNTLHHHHTTQRLPFSAMNNQPPQFPYSHHQESHKQEYHSRPQVQMPAGNNGQPNLLVTSSQHETHTQTQTFELLQPKPHPAQLQQFLMRTALSPSSPGPQTGASQTQLNQGYSRSLEKSDHALSLLNVLRGKTNQMPPNQQQFAVKSQTAHVQSPAQRPQTGPANSILAGFANQYDIKQNSAQRDFSLAQSPQFAAASPPPRMDQPTDAHRSALLGMFQKKESPKNATQTIPPESPLLGLFQKESPKNGIQNPPKSSVHAGARILSQTPEKSSMASVLEAAAHEKGRPIVANPELNLPYGALKIASRPKPNHPSADNIPSQQIKGKKEIARSPAHTSPASPTFLHGKASPKYAPSGLQRMESADSQQGHHRLEPSSSPGYPYKGTISVVYPNRAPSTSPLHMVSKPRQAKSAEQQNNLLFLFGSPKAEFSSSAKGKGPAQPDHTTSGCRVGAVASTNLGGQPAPVTSTSTSRRGSKTPLSPSDQQFLWGFLNDFKKENPTKDLPL